MAHGKHYHVYVMELSRDVLSDARFMCSNPGYQSGKPCVYVGMIGLDPDVRFAKNKAGIQANRFVLTYGLYLLPELLPSITRLLMKRPEVWKWNWALIFVREDMGFGRHKKQYGKTQIWKLYEHCWVS